MGDGDFELSAEEEETLSEWSFVKALDRRPSILAHFVESVAKGVYQGLKLADVSLPTQQTVAHSLPPLIQIDPIFLGLLKERPRFYIKSSQRELFAGMLARFLVCYHWGEIVD